ncbi:MAG: hypothetical protein PHH54_05875 [Candidatus Nanoarchaeia archaeon]|nr:hypothetical protein [Candidatus Nanoarchaeia archaeon]MDD5741484.1 hypothetical protein [Candidatus Nanoarchaeia archaeon]
MEDRLDLDDVREEYNQFKKKYDLPEFNKLNEVFDIEDLIEYESEFLLRRIRKIISERISGYLRFFEIILNPSNSPIFFFKIIKKLNNDDREKLNKIYERFGNLEIGLIKLDLDYDEKKEAEFIKDIFNVFSEIKPDILSVIDKMLDGGSREEKDKSSYFG